MTLNSLLRQKVGRGAFTQATPVIIEIQTDKFEDVLGVLSTVGVSVRHKIKGFNQVAAILPNRLIDRLNDNEELVETIFFDDEVPFPFQATIEPRSPIAPGSVIARSFGLPAILPKASRAMGLRPKDFVNQAKFFTSRFMKGPTPDPSWIPTSEVRKLVGADDARDEGIEGLGVKVAVLDTGVPVPGFIRRHPQLGGRVTQIHLTMGPRPDKSGHGSHVTGIIGGSMWKAPNGLVLEGVAPRCTMASVKVLQTPLGIGRNSDIIKGIERAGEWGANIINMSLGSDTFVPDSPFEGPFANIGGRGVIPIVAAGNAGPGPSSVGTPGGSRQVVSVGSVSKTGSVAGFSSRGPVGSATKPDVMSYGGDNVKDESIYSTTAPGSFMDTVDKRGADGRAPLMGTSQATPAFAGLVALWWEWMRKNKSREMTFVDLMAILSINGGSKSNDMGYGIAKYDWVKAI